jgi:glycosyltransferase involved in cell wall biosynthesis
VYKYLQKSSIAEYLGYLNKEDVLNVFRQSDIFILPSFKESFGLVYAEALSQALPVVYSQNQGFDNQFKDGFVGYSVNPKNALDISEKITMIIDNYKSISSRCIIASDTFSWEIISKKYMEIYKEIKNS